MSTDDVVIFDEIIGEAIRKRDEEEAKYRAERDAEDQIYRMMMAPIWNAFNEIIITRKPRTPEGDFLKLEKGDFYSCRSIVAFHINRGYACYFICARWSKETGYRVFITESENRNAQYKVKSEEFFYRWQEAYRRTLEYLAPHIATCDRRDSE